jgi:hypothetical protein
VTNNGPIRSDQCITKRNDGKIDDWDQTILKDPAKIIDYKLRAVGTESLIVERNRDFIAGLNNGRSETDEIYQ